MKYSPDAVVIGFTMEEPTSRYQVAHIQPEHFPDAQHARIWRLLLRIADDDDAAGVPRPILPNRLTEADAGLDRGIVATLAAVGKTGYAAIEYEASATILIQRWKLRRYEQAARTILALAEEGLGADDPSEAVEGISGEVFLAEKETAAAEPNRDVHSAEELSVQQAALLDARRADPSSAYGCRSGWSEWDSLHYGARPGRLGLTIAPTGVGKTSFMLNLGAAICDYRDFQAVPGLYVNCEMTVEDVLVRLAAIRLRGDVSLQDIETGNLSEWQIQAAAERTASSGLAVTGPSEKTIGSVCALLAQHALRRKIRWACVDHLLELRLTPEEEKQSGGMPWRQHVRWVQKIHAVAQRYGFAVEVVGQAGAEDMDASPGKEPRFSAMQGARAVLNHADSGRVLWYAGARTHVVTLRKNRGGRAAVRIAYEFKRTHGIWSERGLWWPEDHGKPGEKDEADYEN